MKKQQTLQISSNGTDHEKPNRQKLPDQLVKRLESEREISRRKIEQVEAELRARITLLIDGYALTTGIAGQTELSADLKYLTIL